MTGQAVPVDPEGVASQEADRADRPENRAENDSAAAAAVEVHRGDLEEANPLARSAAPKPSFQEAPVSRTPACQGRRLSRRIVSAGMKRVAASDATQPFPYSPQRSVLLDRFDHVLRACRSKSTGGAQERTDSTLIKTNRGDERGRKPTCDQDSTPVCIAMVRESLDQAVPI